MKSFSNETLNIFFFRKFCFSYILDLAKTVRALRILSQKSTRNFVIKGFWALENHVERSSYSFGNIQNAGETESSFCIILYIIQNNYSIYLTGRVSIFYEIFVQSCDFSYVETIDEKWIRGLYIYIYIIYGWAGIYILVTSRIGDPAQLSYIKIVLNYWFLNSYSLELLCITLAHTDCIFFNMHVILLVIILILILLFILLYWFLCIFTKVQVLKYHWGA